MTLETKNPGARLNAAGASLESQRSITGDDDLEAEAAAHACRQANYDLPQPRSGDAAVAILHLGKPSHRIAALDAPEAVGLLVTAALRTGGHTVLDRYRQLAWGLRLKLSIPMRRALAWAALMALDQQDALEIAQEVIPDEDRAGWPMVPLRDVLDEAAFWAGHASPEELQAYAVACFVHLPPGDQGAFLDLVQRRTAA